MASLDEQTRGARPSGAAPPRRSLLRLSFRAFAGGLLLSVVVGIAVFMWGDGWLASGFSNESLLLAVIVLAVSLVLHECAHALVAALLGFQVVEIRIGSGPRLLRCRVGSTALDVRVVPSFGYVSHVPKRGVRSYRRSIAVAVAGPVATIITTTTVVVFAPGPWKFAGFLVAALTIPANIVPREISREGRRWRNDGLLIRDLVRQGEQTRREWTIACESERVTLVPVELGDIDAFLASIDDEVMRRQGLTPETKQQFQAGFAQYIARVYQRWPCILAVRDRATSEFFGCYQLYEFGASGDSAQLGWWLGANARGRGLGSESLELALRYAHTNVGIRRIIMGTMPDNARAIAQIEGAGATFAHEARHTLPNGEQVPALWFEHV